jgi:uncharacterized protein (DUF58 family)
MNVTSFLRRSAPVDANGNGNGHADPAHALPGADLLDPEVISRLGPLDLVAMRIVEGFLAGQHRSPFKGGSIEFAEHRNYTPGDEIRMIDWRAVARSDRYYIKQFEEDTNLQSLIVLDASGSMGFGHSTISKFRYAQMAAACLARLLLHQRDSAGLAVVDTRVRAYIPPRTNPSHFSVIVDQLARTGTGGETSLAAMLHELARRVKRRGLIMLLSDCFDDCDALLNSLHHLRARGHDLMLLHVMAPEELSFSFNKWSRFECLEIDGRKLDLDPSAVRKKYLQKVESFLARLREGCGEIGCDYCPLTTDQPLGDALAYYLRRREARVR